MSFQAIRYYYERAVIAVCNSEGIEYRAENQLVPGGDASSEYVTARLQFTNFNEEAIGCISTGEHRRCLYCGALLREGYRPRKSAGRNAENYLHSYFPQRTPHRPR